MSTTVKVHCSFCKKLQTEVSSIIQGDSVSICSECVALCGDMVTKFNFENNSKKYSMLYPEQIKSKLDEEIIGHEHAKKVLSVAAFLHTLRINSKVGEKSNILLIGPTGSGKTRMMEILAKIIDVPLAIADATTLTEAGYVGDDVESIISRLLQMSDYNVERAQSGIIYLDEVDKIARTSDNRSISRDVSGEGVQQALLKLIEGTIAHVPQKSNFKHPNQEMRQVDTRNILFICGGSFDGLDKLMQSRTKYSPFGMVKEFISEPQDLDLSGTVTQNDLVKFGLIPELVGRLPIRIVLEKLTEQDLVNIIKIPKSSILNQYRNLLGNINLELNITDEAIALIAQYAMKQNSGARGIRSIIEELLLNTVYEIKNSHAKRILLIDADKVRSIYASKS